MTEVVEKVTVTGEGLTLSRLIWNRFHAPQPQLLSRILDLNVNISAHDLFLPVGTVVMMPIPEDEDQDEPSAAITLWS